MSADHDNMEPDDDYTHTHVVLTKGTMVSHYRIIEKIGAGGMGEVYLAEDTQLDRKVALKFLPQHLCQDEECRTRFKREAQAAAKLNHPNIVTIYEVGEHQGRSYFAMEYVKGQSLKNLILERNLELNETTELAIQICEGLNQAHQERIIHRDIKPSNIVINAEGRAKLLDFGLAAIQGAEQLTKTGSTLGTVAYMSPEQARGDPVDHRTDIWSVGVVLYEMVTGRLPFRGERDPAVVHSILNDNPEPPRQANQDIPPELERIILRALEKNPDSRYHSVREPLERLQTWRASETSPSPHLPKRKPLVRRPVLAIPLTLVLLTALFLSVQYIRHTSQVNWARKEALPRIMGLVEDEDFRQAFDLASEVMEIIPSDPLLLKQWDEISRKVSINTSLPGARVFIKDYNNANEDWAYLGMSPIDSAAIPIGFYRWKIEKDGYQTILIAASGAGGRLDFVLDRSDSIPEEMVRVRGGGRKPWLGTLTQIEIIDVEDFLIDRFEVTNEQYQAFLDSGGYGRKDFWKHKFAKDREVLSWDDAVALFRDATGRPGPATWELSRYPEGQGDFPVTGISWYEAAAFAEFTGKQLPTVHHWAYAASVRASAYIIPHSNYDLSGLAATGSYDGLGYHGTYDMAGNAREWCYNSAEGDRFILGGCWSDPAYAFHLIDRISAFDRSPTNGFRCAKYLIDSIALKETFEDIHPAPIRDYRQEAPVSDEVFEAYSAMYHYLRSPLNATVELVDSQSEMWTIERISFDAGYGNERMFGYLFHPAGVMPPYQIIILFPGAYAMEMKSSGNGHNLNSWGAVDFIIKSGRAVFYPVYKSTHERGDGFNIYSANEVDFREHAIMWWKDLTRSIDYLETRPDIDTDRLCYVGSSMGAWIAPIFLALDNRFKVAALRLGGFPTFEMPPALDPIDFAPRVKIPVLMLNGRYDYLFPYETSQIPMFETLGASPENKRHVLFETAHSVHGHRNEMIREVLDWLDRYLGPVK